MTETPKPKRLTEDQKKFMEYRERKQELLATEKTSPLRTLEHEEFVSEILNKIQSSNGVCALESILVNASLAEATGRITIEEGKQFYGELADVVLSEIKFERYYNSSYTSSQQTVSNQEVTLLNEINMEVCRRLIRPSLTNL